MGKEIISYNILETQEIIRPQKNCHLKDIFQHPYDASLTEMSRRRNSERGEPV